MIGGNKLLNVASRMEIEEMRESEREEKERRYNGGMSDRKRK